MEVEGAIPTFYCERDGLFELQESRQLGVAVWEVTNGRGPSTIQGLLRLTPKPPYHRNGANACFTFLFIEKDSSRSLDEINLTYSQILVEECEDFLFACFSDVL